jgi:hypothetical protein
MIDAAVTNTSVPPTPPTNLPINKVTKLFEKAVIRTPIKRIPSPNIDIFLTPNLIMIRAPGIEKIAGTAKKVISNPASASVIENSATISGSTGGIEFNTNPYMNI